MFAWWLFVVHGLCQGNVVRKLTWQSLSCVPCIESHSLSAGQLWSYLSLDPSHRSLTWCRPRGYNDNVPVVAPCTGTNGHTNHRSDVDKMMKRKARFMLGRMMTPPLASIPLRDVTICSSWLRLCNIQGGEVESIAVNNDGHTPGHLWLQSIGGAGGQWREINNTILNYTAFIAGKLRRISRLSGEFIIHTLWLKLQVMW